MHTTFDDLAKSYLPSGRLWKGFAPPTAFGPHGNVGISQSGNPCFGFFDNFHAFNETSLDGPYTHLVTAGGSAALAADTATEKGLLALTTAGDTAEDEIVLKWGSTLSAPFKLADNDLVFECRVALSAITTDVVSVALGLGDAGMIVTDKFFTDADILDGDGDFLGFAKLVAETGDFDGAYQDADGAYIDGGTKTKLNALATFTASATTYKKLGFRYRAHPQKVEWYVDGVLAGDSATPARLTDAECKAASFPNDVLLAPYIAIKDKAGTTALTVNLDWWGCAQMLG